MPNRRPPHDVVDPPAPDRDLTDPFTDPFTAAVDDEPDPAEVLARMRPPAPRSWRDRLDDALDDLRSGPRTGAPAALAVGGLALVVVALVAVLGWRLLAAPDGAPEAGLPVATPAVDASPDASGSAASTPSPGDATVATGQVADSVSVSPVVTSPDGGTGAVGSAGSEVVVHVVGAVANPGVQRLAPGARVTDAIEAAGGATPDADLARVNLAAVVTDGAQIAVPRPGEVLAPAAGPTGSSGASVSAGGADAGDTGGVGELVNVNTAGSAELEELPGVGPVTAEAIIAHREEAGPFTSVDDLVDVRGIGEATLEQIRPQATV